MKITNKKTINTRLPSWHRTDGIHPNWLTTYDTVYMESEGHDLRNLGRGDVGGDWLLHKVTDRFTSTNAPQVVVPIWGRYGGYTLAASPYPGAGCPYITSTSEPGSSGMTMLGTKAIAMVAPTNPYENLTDAVAQQIGVALPGLIGAQFWRDRALTARNAGSEFLNVEFGWLPLISDVRKTLKAITDAGPILRDFIKGSGKKTRKGYHFPREVTVNYIWPGPIWTTGGNGGGGLAGFVHQRQTVDTWFKGCFTYYVPDGSSQLEKLARYESLANHLLGTRITPEVLWDATPWTWALDWFGNTGDVLRNLSLFNSDGLVLNYGYVMQTSHLHTEISIPTADPVALHVIDDTWKKRIRATPYGFGVDMHSLSAMQIAILTALGLSRGLPGRGD